MKQHFIVFFLFLSTGLYSQEICDNGIDDDGDSLIDLADDECNCVPSLITTIEADFESFTCCPSTITAPQFFPDYVYIPNVFSPNRDGINDEFTIFTSGYVQNIAEIRIFDRWGGLVFEQLEQSPGTAQFWDGTARGKQCAVGVYAYIVVLELANGELEQLSGDITLLR